MLLMPADILRHFSVAMPPLRRAPLMIPRHATTVMLHVGGFAKAVDARCVAAILRRLMALALRRLLIGRCHMSPPVTLTLVRCRYFYERVVADISRHAIWRYEDALRY